MWNWLAGYLLFANCEFLVDPSFSFCLCLSLLAIRFGGKTDLVLEDFCQVVGAENALIPHQRAFLRNVFDEPTGDIGDCTAELESKGFLVRSDVCIDLALALKQQSSSPLTKKYPRVTSFVALMSLMAVL